MSFATIPRLRAAELDCILNHEIEYRLNRDPGEEE